LQTNDNNISLQTNAPGDPWLLDRAAAVLLVTVISVSVLYPETFILDFPIVGSERTLPLSILLPVVIVFTLIYAIKRLETVHIGYVDIAVLTLAAYVLLRNAPAQAGMIGVKYALLGLGLFFLTAMLSRRIDLNRLIMWLFVGLACITCLYALLEYILQKNIIFEEFITTTIRQPEGELHRAGSTLVHPVSFGAFLIQLLPFCILAWYTSRDSRQRVLGLVTSALATLALFLTYSKGSWIVAVIIIGCLVFYAVWQRSSRAIYIIALFVAMLAVVTGAFWQQMTEDMSDRSAMSVDLRLAGWKAAIEGIMEHPLIGVGQKQGDNVVWSHLDAETQASVIGGNLNLPVDNYYLNVFLEEGLAGLVLWLLVMSLMIREGIILIRRDTPARPWAVAALAGMAGIFLNAITFDALLIWSNYVIFWVTAGLLHGLSQGERTETATNKNAILWE